MRRSWGVLLAVLALGAVAATPAGAGVHRAGTGSAMAVRSAVRAGPASALPRVDIGLLSMLPASATLVGPPPEAPAVPVARPVPAPPAASGQPPASGHRVLYLTFDDGPDPHWTPQVLALLARYQARATFFEVGSQVRDHPSTAQLVRDAGQAIGNHTGHHRDLTTLTGPPLRHEISSGVAAATCLRPPYGAVDSRVRRAATLAGQQIVLWTVDTEDWRKLGARQIQHHLLHDVRPGRIVLMHDGGGDRSQTLAALRAALPRIQAKGYRFEVVPGC